MFFILSKILQFLINPMVWIVVLLFFSLFAKEERFRKRSLRFLLIFTILFSNSFLFNECQGAWEIPVTPYSSLKKYEVGIVLGGIMKYDRQNDRLRFQRGSDRLFQAIELYKRGYIKKIVFTGGSGSVLHPEDKEGPWVERYLLTLGIPPQDFLIEGESQNTHENAVYTKALLDKNNFKGEFLLITSAFHMRRSLGCFEKEGMHVSPYSTDRYAGPRKFEFDHLLIPDASALYDFNNLIHEVVGYITYKMVGYA